MELDSPSPTPEYSPTLVPELIEQLSLSPQITLASPSIASSSGVRDAKLSPIDPKLLSGSSAPLHPDISPLGEFSYSNVDNGHQKQLSSNNLEVEPILIPQATSHSSNMILESISRPGKASGKQEIRNPFVSAGFVTNFVGSVGRLSTHEEASVVLNSVKTEDVPETAVRTDEA